MRALVGLTFAVMSAAACAGVSAILLPGTVADHYGDPDESDALAPQAVFRAVEAIEVGMGSRKEGENMIPVNAQGAFTNFGDFYAYSFPVKFDAPMPSQKIRLNSYLVRPDKKTKYVLYPIATAFDEQGERLGTLFPMQESNINGNVIANIIVLPEGTHALLLHTHPRFLTYDPETGGVKSSEEVLKGIGALGGAIGGMFAGVLFNSQVERGKVAIAPVGIVEVMRYETD